MTELAGISHKGNLVSEDLWHSHVESLKADVGESIDDEKKAISILKGLLVNSVKKRIPKGRFGILFSGGVDSTLIAYLCKKEKADFICYTVGTSGSEDLREARSAAKMLGFKHVHKELSIEELDSIFRRLGKILPTVDVVSIGVGSVELAALELAKEEGIKIFFGGLGSEEIFAGYQRHEDAKDINDECWSGLMNMYQRDFVRDFSIAKETGSSFLTPFLDSDLIVASMSIDESLKIKEGHKKYILRKAAIALGLPEEFALRPKKAAQYGSNFDKAIAKLAKMNGFKFKKQYLESLIK
jgi:asparagine synthetase B (glutamine-hydrolysing)